MVQFVVATAVVVTVEFKFPFSVTLGFEQDAVEFELVMKEMVFIDLGGGAGRHSRRPVTSRQVALTRR